MAAAPSRSWSRKTVFLAVEQELAQLGEEVRAMRAGAPPPRPPRVFADADMDF